MRMRVLLAAAALLAVSCGARAPTEAGDLRPEDLTTVERQAFVYAAAVRYVVETESPDARRIYVLHTDAAGTAIPRGVQDRVREELALLGRVTFVPAGHEAARAAAEDRSLDDAVVITLGPVPGGEDRVQVEARSDVGVEDETTRTLILKRHGLRWRVEASEPAG